MYLKSIHFRDWKAYPNVSFDFPTPQAGKNVILIGAKNGFGKTSLLEGIVLGLFGRDGLRLVGRSTFGEGGEDKLEYSYDEFLERAFHAQAREQGRSSASIELTFEESHGDRITLQRIWHFSGSGKHRRQDEEVRIWTGPDGDLLTVPALEDRDEFIRGFIAQQFLPVHLAQFFLFDGEQVQRLAKRDMAGIVRLGIEGILGVPLLRELTEDLRRYAKDRRKMVGNVGDEKIDRLSREIEEIGGKEEELEKELGEIKPQSEPLARRRDELFREISSLHGGSYANLKELYEAREKYDRKREQYREELRRMLSFDIALAIAGPSLRKQTRERLRAEDIREKWQLGKQQGEEGFNRFLASIDRTDPPVDPPLTEEQRDRLEQKLKNAWQNLWYPPPNGCASSFRHPYAKENERALVQERLERAENLAISKVGEILRQIKALDEEIRKIDAQVASQQGIDKEAEKLAADFKDVQERHNQLENRRREIERELEGYRGQLNPKRQELARLQESYHTAEPKLRRANMAEQVGCAVNEIIEEAFPKHITGVAREMTRAYKAMAHKNYVDRIEIDPDCSVRLLGGRGRNIREMDASAGESQIFALSLIAAIASISERAFPIVMDTPLARLDPDHRRNVLKYFTDTTSQIVLLSHPEEVTGEYLELIEPKVLKSLHIEHQEIADGVGKSQVVEGYYGSEAA